MRNCAPPPSSRRVALNQYSKWGGAVPPIVGSVRPLVLPSSVPPVRRPLSRQILWVWPFCQPLTRKVNLTKKGTSYLTPRGLSKNSTSYAPDSVRHNIFVKSCNNIVNCFCVRCNFTKSQRQIYITQNYGTTQSQGWLSHNLTLCKLAPFFIIITQLLWRGGAPIAPAPPPPNFF